MELFERGKMLSGKMSEIVERRLDGIERELAGWARKEGVVLDQEKIDLHIEVRMGIGLRERPDIPKSEV